MSMQPQNTKMLGFFSNAKAPMFDLLEFALSKYEGMSDTENRIWISITGLPGHKVWNMASWPLWLEALNRPIAILMLNFFKA